MTIEDGHTITSSYIPGAPRIEENKAAHEEKQHKLKGTFSLSRILLNHAIFDIFDFKYLPLLSFQQLRLYYQLLNNPARPVVTPDYRYAASSKLKRCGVRSLVTGDKCSGAVQYLLHLKLARAEAQLIDGGSGGVAITFRASTEQELLEDTDYLQGPKESPKII